jgi:hypothetical protein
MRETFFGVPEVVWVGVQAIWATVGIVGLFFIRHLYYRDWVYVPAGTGKFRRVTIKGSDMLPRGMQGIKSGLDIISQQVVSNALTLRNAADR